MADNDEEGETNELRARRRCPKCGTAMDSYLVDAGRKLHVCGNNPDCGGFLLEEGQYRLKGYDGPTIECDKCNGRMELKSGRFGQYFACTSCANTRKVLKNGEAAPPKADPIRMEHLRCSKTDDFFVLRDGAAGLFLAASQFPKHRETRAPTIAELRSVQDRLDPKYHYLLQAPDMDDMGNPAQLRFSRKTKEQYVTTELEGKPSGWQAYFRNGHWQIEKGKKPKSE